MTTGATSGPRCAPLTEDLAAQLARVNPALRLVGAGRAALPHRRGDRPDSRRRSGRRRRHGRPGRGRGAPGGGAGRRPRLRSRPLFVDFAAYERDLDLLGVNDAQLAAGHHAADCGSRSCGPRSRSSSPLPFAAIGVVVHVVPFQIMKQVAKRPTNEGIKATVKLLGCFVLFALTYAVVGVIVGRAFGAVGRARWRPSPRRSAATSRCGCSSGCKRIGGLVEGYRIVRAHRDMLDSVLAHRAAVVRDARAVLAGA